MMKGLLLKSFYVFKSTRIRSSIYHIVLAVVGASLFFQWSYFSMVVALGIISYDYIAAGRDKWSEYSLALPYTPAQRINASYIFFLLYGLLAWLCSTVVAVIFHVTYPGRSAFIRTPFAVFWMFAMLAFMIFQVAVLVFIRVASKQGKRFSPLVIPYSVLLAAFLFFSVKSALTSDAEGNVSFSPRIAAINELYSPFPAIALLLFSIIILAVSWLMAIYVAEKRCGVKSKKAIAASSISLTAVAVASAYAVIMLAAVNGVFTEDLNAVVVRRNMNALINDITRERMVQMPVSEFEERLGKLGFTKGNPSSVSNLLSLLEDNNSADYTLDCYYTYKDYDDGTSVSANFDTTKTNIESFSVSSGSSDKMTLKKATLSQLNEKSQKFTAGMSESEMLAVMKSMDALPSSIYECYGENNTLYRDYSLIYTVDSFEGGNGASYAIEINLAGGKISKVSTDYSVEGEEYGYEAQELQISAEEFERLATGFLGETAVGVKGEECAAKLEALGYCRDENEDYFGSIGFGYLIGESDDRFTLKFEYDFPYEKTDPVGRLDFRCREGAGQYRKTMTEEELKEILSGFESSKDNAGVCAECVKQGIVPDYIHEARNANGDVERTYDIEISTSDYSGEGWALIAVYVTTVNGEVTEVKTNDFETIGGNKDTRMF